MNSPGFEIDLLYNQIVSELVALAAMVGVTNSAVTSSIDYKVRTALPAAIASAQAAAIAACPAETAATVGSLIAGASEKSVIATGDKIALSDSEASGILKWGSTADILQALYLQGMSKPLVNVTTPWLYAPSGTVVAGAAGGAYVTLGTALPAAIPVAGKVYLPAVGSLSAGWYDFYSATTGQVNLASAVASGGAYTATTGVDIVGPSYTLPGGALGPNGYIERFIEGWTPNTAGSKITKVLAGAAAIWQLIYTTSLSVSSPSVTKNRNSQSQQQTGFYGITTANGVSTINAFMDPAVDLSASTTISLSFRLNVPTDYFCLLGWRERATYGA